jgi:hypothetical protein
MERGEHGRARLVSFQRCWRLRAGGVLVDEDGAVAATAGAGGRPGDVAGHGADVARVVRDAFRVGRRRLEARERPELVRHVVLARVVAGLAVQGGEVRVRRFDVVVVPERLDRIGVVDRRPRRDGVADRLAEVEVLHRVDRVDVGVDVARLHLEMRPAAQVGVADAAADHAGRAVGRGVEGDAQRVVAGVALLDRHDVAAVGRVIRDDGVRDQVEGLRDAADRDLRLVRQVGVRKDGDLGPLQRAGGHGGVAGPAGEVRRGDERSRGGTGDDRERALRAVGEVALEPGHGVAARDEVLRVVAVEADHHHGLDGHARRGGDREVDGELRPGQRSRGDLRLGRVGVPRACRRVDRLVVATVVPAGERARVAGLAVPGVPAVRVEVLVVRARATGAVGLRHDVEQRRSPLGEPRGVGLRAGDRVAALAGLERQLVVGEDPVELAFVAGDAVGHRLRVGELHRVRHVRVVHDRRLVVVLRELLDGVRRIFVARGVEERLRGGRIVREHLEDLVGAPALVGVAGLAGDEVVQPLDARLAVTVLRVGRDVAGLAALDVRDRLVRDRAVDLGRARDLVGELVVPLRRQHRLRADVPVDVAVRGALDGVGRRLGAREDRALAVGRQRLELPAAEVVARRVGEGVGRRIELARVDGLLAQVREPVDARAGRAGLDRRVDRERHRRDPADRRDAVDHELQLAADSALSGRTGRTGRAGRTGRTGQAVLAVLSVVSVFAGRTRGALVALATCQREHAGEEQRAAVLHHPLVHLVKPPMLVWAAAPTRCTAARPYSKRRTIGGISRASSLEVNEAASRLGRLRRQTALGLTQIR